MRLAEGESKGIVIGANCTADAILAIREGASSPVNMFSLSSSFAVGVFGVDAPTYRLRNVKQ